MTGAAAYAGIAKVQPAFGSAGAGTSTANVAYPSGIIAGNWLVLWMHAIDSAAAYSTPTPTGWTQLATANTGAGPGTIERLYVKPADGTESGRLATGWTADTALAGRMYRMSGTSSTSEIGAGSVSTASSASQSAPTLITTGTLELAIWHNSAVVNNTIGDSSGETGGDWTEAVAEFNVASPTLTAQLQTAGMAAAGTITGGTATLGAAGTNRFSLRGALSA